jgi:hypothetical protein
MVVEQVADAPASGPAVTLVARGLTKVYRTGDVEVRALRDVDFELFERNRFADAFANAVRAPMRPRQYLRCIPSDRLLRCLSSRIRNSIRSCFKLGARFRSRH